MLISLIIHSLLRVISKFFILYLIRSMSMVIHETFMQIEMCSLVDKRSYIYIYVYICLYG